MFIIYTPPLHVVFGGSYHLSPLYWLIPAAFGCLLLAWASLRVVLLRKSIEEAKVKPIKGLKMCTLRCFRFVRADADTTLRSPHHAYYEHSKQKQVTRSFYPVQMTSRTDTNRKTELFEYNISCFTSPLSTIRWATRTKLMPDM